MIEERPSGRPDAGHDKDDDDSGVGRRPLLSLAAQRRRKDEEERRRREKLAAEPVVDPGPPDPMIAALEALSGIQADEDREENGAEGAETPEGGDRAPRAATPPEPSFRAEPPTGDEPAAEVRTDDEPAEGRPTPSRPEAAPTTVESATGPAPDLDGAATAPPPATGDDGGDNGAGPETVIRTVVRRSEPARPRPARPSRPVYTLQEVHEHTGIPYAKLALYAASHADQIPSVGERRSPAYLREGMEAFCRLHALKEPGWEMPELGPERGWDDERGLAARLEALETAQHATADQLRGIVRTLRRPWSGQATWE